MLFLEGGTLMSRKEAILQAATHLFSQKGFKNTSMGELSRLIGVAQGTIFYHFKNKIGLFLAILEAIKTDILEQFDRYTTEMRFESGMEMIEGIVTFYLHMAGSMEDRFLLLHRHDAYEMARENAVFREHLEAIFTSFVDVFERALLLGQEDGSIEKTQGKKTAFILFSMVDGLVRLDTFKLYHGGSLYDELISSCRRMLQRQDTRGCSR